MRRRELMGKAVVCNIEKLTITPENKSQWSWDPGYGINPIITVTSTPEWDGKVQWTVESDLYSGTKRTSSGTLQLGKATEIPIDWDVPDTDGLQAYYITITAPNGVTLRTLYGLYV